MGNERLRAVMTPGGWTNDRLAQAVDVDPKTVERWVNLGRVPHRRIAFAVAKALGEDVFALWPDLRAPRPSRSHVELVALYSRRADAPPRLWWDLFSQAKVQIDILVYAAVFLHEQHPGLNDLLALKGDAGCEVRIMLGDPDSENVRTRGAEERFGQGIQSRCRQARMYYEPLVGKAGVQLRSHATTLYNSIYRADDQMLVNSHLWGMNAYAAPLWHLRRADNGPAGLFDAYTASLDEAWTNATPWEG